MNVKVEVFRKNESKRLSYIINTKTKKVVSVRKFLSQEQLKKMELERGI